MIKFTKDVLTQHVDIFIGYLGIAVFATLVQVALFIGLNKLPDILF